jgi:DNA-binding beta-propeller fold protein YncE
MNDVMKSGDFGYRIDLNWSKLLGAERDFMEIADIAVDAKDRVYIFCRWKHPVMVFDRDGKFLYEWGEGVFNRPHGITIDPEGNVWCVDDRDSAIKKFTPDGKLLLTVGTPGKSSEYQSGNPFNEPTKVAFEPGTGSFYVSDGYCNSRIHKYSKDGELIFSWGTCGIGPGEFNLPHSVCTDRQGRIYVADRESHRIQVFDDKGRYITEWNHIHRPCALFITDTDPQLAVVGQVPPQMDVNLRFPNLGSRITIHDLSGKCLASLGEGIKGEATPSQFIAPHGIAVDSRGDIYIGEVCYSFLGEPDAVAPWKRRTFRKLIRIV